MLENASRIAHAVTGSSDPPSCEVRPLVATPTLPIATSTMKCFETTGRLL
jgi:hypothetical protein